MLNLVKDIVNPKNWLKLLKDPIKIKNFINRLNYYPGLKFAYSKSRFYRYLEIFFLIKLAKKNKAFQNFFLTLMMKNSKIIDSYLILLTI